MEGGNPPLLPAFLAESCKGAQRQSKLPPGTSCIPAFATTRWGFEGAAPPGGCRSWKVGASPLSQPSLLAAAGAAGQAALAVGV